MIEVVIKSDGSKEKFDLDKLSRWAKYAAKLGGDWSTLVIETFSKLPTQVKSEDIHQAMIDVCYSKKDLIYSRVASRLEMAQIRKNIERKFNFKVNTSTFKTARDILIKHGIWCKDTIPPYRVEQEDLYNQCNAAELESWQVKQYVDKYLLKHDGVVIETPALAAMGIGLGMLGDNKDGWDLATDIAYGRSNKPTPTLNGIRNGDFNGISCCVISAGDSVDSIQVGQHLGVVMTSKKAGIGIEFNTRSKNAPVKNGTVDHLGKHPIYKHIDTGVKEFTQVTRGGSATVTFKCIDPEAYNIALWKSQRIDIDQRIDKLDYSFAFNDAFFDAVINKKDWYLFDLFFAPKLHEMFYTSSKDEYNKEVQVLLESNVPHTKVKALDMIKHMLLIRQEVGRLYFYNVSRANTHTPFLDPIYLSNLCQEINIPTKPYIDMRDLYSFNGTGETGFCSLGALVPSNIKSDEEYERCAYTIVKSINAMIHKSPKMAENHERTMIERMSIGVGITGLADYMYQHGIDYDGSDESLEFVHDLAEKHAFYLYKASIKLSEETGQVAKGVDFNWLPIDTRINTKFKLKQDWESIRGLPRVNSVLIAHMPTESSALASGVTNGVYPPRKYIISKKSRKGIVQFICKGFKQGKNLLAYDIDNITLSKYYSVLQDYTDQGISADTYFNPNDYPDGKKPLSVLLKEFIIHFKLGNKSWYYLNTYDNDDVSVFDMFTEDEECSSCTL